MTDSQCPHCKPLGLTIAERVDVLARRQLHVTEAMPLPPSSLAELLEALRTLHSPWAIFDECACDDKTSPTHVEIDDVGLTCNRMYSVCKHCCLGGDYSEWQSEECIDGHRHGPDLPICPTIGVLAEYARRQCGGGGGGGDKV